LLIFIQVATSNVGDIFSGFLFVLPHVSFGLLFLGSAKTYIG